MTGGGPDRPRPRATAPAGSAPGPRTAPTAGVSASRALRAVLGPPAQQPALHLLDAQRHHDADRAEGDERDHHVRRVERAERLGDEVAEAAPRLAAQQLAHHHADQRERDRRREGGERPRQRRGDDHRAHDLPLARAEKARRVDEVGVDRTRALERVEEHDEEDDRPRQHHLGEETEADDHGDERHQRDPRQRVERDDVRLQHARQAVVAPEHEPGHEAGGDADHEAPQRGLHRGEGHLPQAEPDLAGREVDEAAGDGGRPADEERVDPVEAGGPADRLDAGQPLPPAEQRDEDRDAPEVDPRPIGHLLGPPWGCPPWGYANSSPSTCQRRPYSRAYSSLSRSAMTSRGRVSFTSCTIFTRPGRRVITTMRSASVIASERSWVTKTTV